MTARRIVLSVLLSVAALGPPGPARADEPAGAPCTLVRTGSAEAVVTGGPVAGTGTLTCTVQIGFETHDGPDAGSASATGAGVVVLEPREMSSAYAGGHLYLCTAFTPAGGAPRYWSFGQWGADPGAGCDLVFPDASESVYEILYGSCDVDLCFPFVDCMWFRALYPGVPGVVEVNWDGDVYVNGELWWDCPPYEQG